MMAAIVCCLFAAQDDPAPRLRSFGNWSVLAVLVTIAYLFAILPRVQDFELLIMALSPAFLLFGLLATKPQTAYASLALSLWSIMLMALQKNYNADFAGVVNSGVALLGGIFLVTFMFRLMRSASRESALLRLIKASRATLAEAAEHRGQHDRARFSALMLDRLSLLAPLLASAEAKSMAQAVDPLSELRIGLNIIELRQARHGLQQNALFAIDTMLAGLARHFRKASPVPDTLLLDQINKAAKAVALTPPGKHRRAALLGLMGIRQILFPQPEPDLPQLQGDLSTSMT